ncbi:MAG: helix-turn-helix domain-containing protein [Erysipelotrichaceae bacterium]|nr:helix-turn-helix domain-containing protein [Erysipelotrichaceae bacterium]
MDQTKIGAFLKELRKEKNLTQEQLAEKFGVAGRTVSRWETGNNMPDLSVLVELADFYDVDIREILDGERKSEIVEKEEKETLLKIAEYAEKQKKQAILRAIILFSLEMICCGYTIAMVIMVLKEDSQIGVGYVIIPALITVAFSVILVVNAKDYVINRQG